MYYKNNKILDILIIGFCKKLKWMWTKTILFLRKYDKKDIFYMLKKEKMKSLNIFINNGFENT